MKIVKTHYIAVPPERVAEALCSEGYNVEEGNSREDVVSTRFELQERGEERVTFEVHYAEYKRTKLGKIDKSGTAPAMTQNTYDARTRSLSWTYSSPAAGDMFSLAAAYQLSPRGEGTEVSYEIEFEVRIPFIGKKLAKLFSREIEQDVPRLLKILERHATA